VDDQPGESMELGRGVDPNPEAENKCYARHGGFIEEAGRDLFDAPFSGISASEAQAIAGAGLSAWSRAGARRAAAIL
jgi:acyl transferase domain-containing protein